MKFKRIDLTKEQLDKKGKVKWSLFLPALSSFYARDVGLQRSRGANYIDPARIPADFEHGIEGLNWLNKDEGYFTYKWSLYSAGHAELDINKQSERDDMIRSRDRKNTFLLGDSGGFQIGKGVWEGDWKDPNCPKASLKRKQVLQWLDAYMDRGMILDIPAWVSRSPAGAKATGISTYQEAVNATRINNDYFMKNRNGSCKFLNVLQGEHHSDAEDWYQQMKDYCDPKKYSQPFEGWAMGGQNMCDLNLILRRIVAMRYDGLLEKGKHDWMHFLGTSKLEWAVLLTDIQNSVRKYHNENFTISYDCASPFLATANGQIYTVTDLTDRQKWLYRMVPSVDNKKYSKDQRRFRDAVLQDGVFKGFEESPISERTKISDICIYGPGDLNKIGKEGRTSWDSFSYTIQMGHNVFRHLYAVQEANRQYEKGSRPEMMYVSLAKGNDFREYDGILYCRDIIDAIFATSSKSDALALIDHFKEYWDNVIGTRGKTGQKTTNAVTQFENHFEFEGSLGSAKVTKPKKAKPRPILGSAFADESETATVVEEAKKHHIDDSGFDEGKLEVLEEEAEV